MRCRWNGPRCGWHARRTVRFAAGTEPGDSALNHAAGADTPAGPRLSHSPITRKSSVTTAGAAAAYAEFSAARH
ncbi:hypothetical protein CBM2634_A50002 [Cupriavidus taiwanensis]|uniref:Uncharacterized protein n=1 Tax=Cupriavidus taiwanensis TaxID=164546 RepID=A0A375J0R7_9BURK|nr:hypothetical protein CBM2634_A50002 [Cupriavidus taiwanensis]